MPLDPGARLGPYEIQSRIGAGGMGTLYRARDTRLGRFVAIKLLSDASLLRDDRRRRFEREALAISSLNHPHICALFDIGEYNGERFLVMEYLDGQTLEDRLLSGPLPAAEVLDYASQIAAALDHAHRARVVHGDLKPSNVMLTESGAKLLDFGVARRAVDDREGTSPTDSREQDTRTVQELFIGTPQYMAPEQLTGASADARSDVFAFGALLYEMATGRKAFRSEDRAALIASILTEHPPALTAAGATSDSDGSIAALERVVNRCLAKKADDRWQRARDLVLELDWIARGRPASVPVASQRTHANGLRLSTGGPPSANPDANRLFENAMQLKVNFDITRGRAMLERALALDPHFAEARAWHAFTNWISLDSGFSNDGTLLYEAEAELQRAVRDEPSLARAHSACAAIYFMQGRKELMPAAVKRALTIHRTDEDALHFLMQYHHYTGDYAKAQDLGRQITDLVPLFYPTRMILGDMRRQQGDLTGAILEHERILEQDPQNIYAIRFLARAYMDGQDLLAARETLERARPNDRQSYWTRLVRAILEALEGGGDTPVDESVLRWGGLVAYMTYEVAALHAVRGDTAGALEWLDRAVRSGDERAEFFRRDPLLGSVRNQPRFEQILESIAYRRQHRQPAQEL